MENGDDEPRIEKPDDGGEEVDAGEIVDGELVGEEGRVAPGRVQMTRGEFHAGPLPRPRALKEYDEVVPGLAREMADQWKAETAYRHKSLDELRDTDKEAMQAFYKAELVGQLIAGVLFLGILGVVVYALSRGDTVAAVAGIIAAGASVIWAVRRRSDGSPPADKAIERPPTDSTDESA